MPPFDECSDHCRAKAQENLGRRARPAHSIDCLSATVLRTDRDILQSSNKVIADRDDGPSRTAALITHSSMLDKI
jgi:hypothetical protein